MMTTRWIVGLAMTFAVLPIAARRGLWLYRLAMTGQPDPDRLKNVERPKLGAALKRQVVEVFLQKKLLKWSIPGAAHFFVFWAFIILGTVYVEAYGVLFDEDFAIPIVGHWEILGFAQDTIALLALAGLATFAAIRWKDSPARKDRASRFKGSHTGGAWLILFMIVNVLWTMFFFRGASYAAGNLPYDNGAYASKGVGQAFEGIDNEHTLEWVETVGLWGHIGVMLVFLIIVVYSKHMHIFIAPLNITFARKPDGLGPLLPMQSGGKTLDFEEADPDVDIFGRSKIEDFTWKGFLDFATCTECGRCQSQCPAWNTGKPLSPKMVILELRDHAFAKAPWLLATEEERENLPQSVKDEAARPLVGTAEENGVIDPDVLWSCTNCGACVEQCPVDIEHIDHIVDMRRYQTMIESNFPSEAGGMLKNLEKAGNPWGMPSRMRTEWTKDLGFDVKVLGQDVEDLSEVEYLFWVGCAGSLDDKAQKTTKAVAELLHIAGVEFAILGQGETCTGDPARRMGNEFVFQMLAMQNIETLNEAKATKIVATCPHCFNTVGREYPELGGTYEVVHHTELLNELVAAGKLKPINAVEGSATYHDPCFLGRHNKVYTPPRELISAVAKLEYKEMERSKERSFCCGAGGARMWMEETIGQRINDNRTEEALSLSPDTIVTGCPFCKTMISDSVAGKQGAGEAAAQGVQVIDVAQLLVQATRPVKVGVAADGPSATNGVAAVAEEPANSPDEPVGSDPGAGSDGAATPDPTVAADPGADPTENPRTEEKS
ncbi:MAG: (Fe-S)-binding protein [Sporichthya sp.]|nr:(Fe-S)-binding protein [Sporichthya sp.]MBA3745720.1 (Fe-S)-binding protein [Sporichthya sp.]